MLDLQVFNAIHNLAGVSRLLDLLGIYLANSFGYLLIVAAAFLIIREKDWRIRYKNAFFVILSLILSRGVITELIRVLYNRPRPFFALNFEPLLAQNSDFSFPSGHTVLYFTLAFAMWHIQKRWGQWFVAGAFVLALARIFVGVHWPLDIAGGVAIAWLGVLIAKKLIALNQSISNETP